MNKVWQLQEAKSKFSEVISNAEMGNIQIVTKRGRDCVAIIPIEEYKKVFESKETLRDLFKKAPKVDLDITRSKDMGRDIEL
ncbi:MAG: type II toxin-antitoxin system prevent-host-death family antitoxin [bacterium]|nr:type II toxin-antitoxin system prevent-host-death family antitoxin [bacterium]